MINLGKNKDNVRVYITDDEIALAAQNPHEWKGKLNRQQWAKLRKLINKYNRKNQ